MHQHSNSESLFPFLQGLEHKHVHDASFKVSPIILQLGKQTVLPGFEPIKVPLLFQLQAHIREERAHINTLF